MLKVVNPGQSRHRQMSDTDIYSHIMLFHSPVTSVYTGLPIRRNRPVEEYHY